MIRSYLISLGAVLGVAMVAGCGDDAKCDPGSTAVDGVCTAVPPNCSDGTILVEDHCEIDPNACQDGTVLVGGACVDPGHVTADVEEAAEPNGFGLAGEASANPAGTITLKPEGEHFVIHGKIIPFQDGDGDGQLNADIDTYEIDVTGPVMLTISADGLHGLAGAFVALANAGSTSPLADWVRFGVNPLGDTSRRQLYLPSAGTYLIAVADSRSLLLSGAAPGAQENKPAFEYYLSIEQVAATPTALTVTDGVASSSGQLMPGEVKLFSVEMGEGINDAELSVTADQVQESLVIANKRSTITSVRAVADGEAGDGATAATGVIGIRTGDQSLVVVDSVIDYSNAAYSYDLTVKVGTAGALPTDGTSVSQPARDDGSFTVFYYDVGSDGRLVGMDLALDRPVAGVVVDEDFFIFSLFSSYHPLFGFLGDTFESYKGLLNHAAPGRYYFLVFDPTEGTGDITATSTYDAVQATPIALGTPLTGQEVNAFASNPFTYSPGNTAPWQELAGSGTGTGVIAATFFRPSDAFGRLDSMEVCDDQGCGAFAPDPLPIFTHTYAEAGTTRGRVMLDDSTTSYLVKVNTATTTGTPTFDLSFAARSFTDLGTANVGTPVTANDQALDATTPVRRYLVRTGAGNRVTITAETDVATLGTRIRQLNLNETAIATATAAAPGDDVSLALFQSGQGWTAFEVSSTTTLAAGDAFDLTVTANLPPYTQSAGSTAYSDACAGGSVVAMDDLDEGRSTNTIATPTGFEFFGVAAPDVRVFSNGFLSFNTSLTCTAGVNCFYSNADIPAAANPNALIAPYWDDLVLSEVCQMTSGTKLIIQWNGTVFGSTTTVIAMQAILDGSNHSIEFVYAPAHTANGSGATIGLENQNGTVASKVGFNVPNSATAKLFTAN